jgi:hypothetical protein
MGQTLIGAALRGSYSACRVAEPRKDEGSFVVGIEQSPCLQHLLEKGFLGVSKTIIPLRI